MSVLPDGAFGDRVRARLRDEYAIWLTTVGADGTPQPNPVWFVWDGAESVLVYSRADAKRLAHLDANPHASLNFDGNGRGGDVVVFAATARRVPDEPAAHDNRAYVEKYANGMRRVSDGLEEFSAAYPVALRFDFRRVRGF